MCTCVCVCVCVYESERERENGDVCVYERERTEMFSRVSGFRLHGNAFYKNGEKENRK